MAEKVHFLDVGCADCTIIETGGRRLMIDCGYRRVGTGVSRPTDIAQYLGVCSSQVHIDLLILTHPHHDHYLGLADLRGRVTFGEIWGSPYDRRTGDHSVSLDDWSEYHSLVNDFATSSNFFTVQSGVRERWGNADIAVLGPRRNANTDPHRECHDSSLVVWVGGATNNFVFCGDASDAALQRTQVDWDVGSCSVLHASHHGSANGGDLSFIQACSPIDTVISTASGAFPNLPHGTALQRYRRHSRNVWRTDISGTCTSPL